MFDFIAFILMLLSTIHIHEGNTWTYVVEPGHTLRIIEVAGTKEIGGNSFFVIKDSEMKGSSMLVRKGQGYLEIREQAKQDKPGQKFPLVQEDPLPFFFFPEFYFQSENVRDAGVTIPAGSFEGCKVFDLYVSRKGSDAKPRFLGTLSYKKGLGLLKMEGPIFGQEVKKIVLSSFHVVKPTVAILDLEEIKTPLGFGRTIAETIRTHWIKRGEYRIVERAMIKKVLDELSLGQTGLIDADMAVKVGKLLGAEKVLVGSVSKVDEEFVLNWRLIDVETALASEAHTVTADSEKELLKKMFSGDSK